jgi:putative ABC transport system permease protein
LLVHQLSTSTNTMFLDLSIDWHVLAFTTLATLATVVLFGTAPAFRAARVAPMDAMKDQGRGAAGDSRGRFASALVVAQVALSVVLIVGAGLFLRTFSSLANLPLGFDRDRVLVVNIGVLRAGLAPAERIATSLTVRARLGTPSRTGESFSS